MEDFSSVDKVPFYKKLWFIITVVVAVVVVIIIIIVVSVVVTKNNKNEENNDPPIEPFLCKDSSGSPSHNCYGAWFYRTHIHDADYNANWAKDHGFNFVFLTTNVKSTSGKNLLKNNAKSFEEKGIAFHAMILEDVTYLDDIQSGVDEARSVLEYVKTENITISGIHLDCEPHAHPDFKSGDQAKRNEVFQKYIKLLEEVRKVVDEYPSILYSAAVAWWYSANTRDGELDNGRGFDLVNSKRLHMLVPMIYDGAGDTNDDVIKHANDYLNDGAPTCIGMAYTDHPDIKNDANAVINSILTNQTRTQYLYGVSVFSNHKYSDWTEN